ncbi:Major facilitator superfamily domain-containing protein [Rhodotorula toruloides]|uniref:Major facilitator superfamily domain-containing protein n=1 Tax=Rhodotorula toruloides TaxID=5286 RepID=A0A2T0ABC0_RHOTO|nr:Major facilitator superfamily domain-containing protein [Rhodotorula toruloides]PRQ75304.1 Major facilitator superfamily domain-containing protein [Rhodotorula toruloides]
MLVLLLLRSAPRSLFSRLFFRVLAFCIDNDTSPSIQNTPQTQGSLILLLTPLHDTHSAMTTRLDVEKGSSFADDEYGAHVVRSDTELEKDGGNLVLQVEDAAAAGLKTAKDGRTILVPQPSDDPRDPLNWPEWKKHAILIIVALAAFGGDFQSGAGIPLLLSQGEEWGLSPAKVNEAGNLNVLLLGIGGLVWIPPLYFWGRLPVLFWTQLLGTFMVLGSVLVQDFTAYYALRPLTSLFLTAGQTIGLTKIGLWVVIFLCSPYCGPFFGGFIVSGLNGQWRPVLWVVFAWSCFVLLLIIFLADETWYDRSLPVQPERPTGIYGRFCNLVGITGIRQRAYKPNAFPSVMRLFEVFTKPTLWMVFVVYALSFMWAVGINITSSIILATPKVAGGYGLTLKQTSVVYLTPLVALMLGEGIGHVANDWIANRYVRKHNGVFKPECRLYIFPFASVLMIAGLVLVGQALAKGLSVGAIVVGWGAYVLGVMVSSVAITAYILDVFPSASGEVSAAVNLSRTISGFSVGYFQAPWGEAVGYDVSFGIQAAIVAFAMGLVFVLIAVGERIRKFGGPLHFAKHQ